jgi:hypothetical protein
MRFLFYILGLLVALGLLLCLPIGSPYIEIISEDKTDSFVDSFIVTSSDELYMSFTVILSKDAVNNEGFEKCSLTLLGGDQEIYDLTDRHTRYSVRSGQVPIQNYIVTFVQKDCFFIDSNNEFKIRPERRKATLWESIVNQT